MINVEVKRAVAPIESVTITLDHDLAVALKRLVGMGYLNLTHDARPNVGRALTTVQNANFWHILDAAGVPSL